jgi:hypothetical protein
MPAPVRFGAVPSPDLSPLAQVVYRVLEVAPGTVDELAAETKLPAGVIDAALAELRSAGLAAEVEPGRWRVTMSVRVRVRAPPSPKSEVSASLLSGSIGGAWDARR